jgi:hypothetical protein
MLQVYVLKFYLPLPSLLTVFATVLFNWYYIINLNACCPLVRPYSFWMTLDMLLFVLKNTARRVDTSFCMIMVQ